MMLASDQAGALHSQSPMDAVVGGDATSMLFRVPKLLVNTAHFKEQFTENERIRAGPPGSSQRVA
jgi:hypothetical protein